MADKNNQLDMVRRPKADILGRWVLHQLVREQQGRE